MHIVESFSGMPLRNKIFRRGEGWSAKKEKVEPSAAKKRKEEGLREEMN